jgi:hypothetical protein
VIAAARLLDTTEARLGQGLSQEVMLVTLGGSVGGAWGRSKERCGASGVHVDVWRSTLR